MMRDKQGRQWGMAGHFLTVLLWGALTATYGLETPPTGTASVVGRVGEEDNEEYLADILVPVLSHGDGLVFVNVRGTHLDTVSGGHDADEQEIAAGLGYRRLLQSPDMILGANAFHDTRWTVHDTQIEQIGAGVELLSRWADFRANYYDPDRSVRSFGEVTEVSVSESSSSSVGPVYSSGGNLLMDRTTTKTVTTTTTVLQHIEEALPGYDAEIAVRIPWISDLVECRAAGGYYHFDSAISSDIEGAKWRVEIQPVPAVKVNVEFYDDKELNGTDYYVGLWITVPFGPLGAVRGSNPFAGIADRFRFRESTLGERMVEPVNRDFRIRTKHLHDPVSTSTSASSTSTTTENLGPVEPPPEEPPPEPPPPEEPPPEPPPPEEPPPEQQQPD